MWYKNADEFKVANGYEIAGQWYPRVTRILEIKAKPALDNFFREMGNFASAEEVKNKSAAEGTLVHEAVQGIMTGKDTNISETIKPAIDAYCEFNERRKITFHPEYVERQVWSLRHRYAGTVDTLATVDGKFGVLDIKTSMGFYPEYNLQTAAYVSALQEFEIKKALGLSRPIETRWILRIDQYKPCTRCGARLREKGGRNKVRPGSEILCAEEEHEWGNARGDIELKEFPRLYKDIRAFIAAKILWEWENDYQLRQISYLT